MNKITLVTNKMCPFARKATIALTEKTSDFNLVQVDLQNKSQFFKQSYSKAIGKIPGRDGTVPILIDEDTHLTESQPIVWYIAQKFQNQGNNILPQNHVQRFKMRLFIEEFSKKIGGIQGKFFGWPKKSQQQQDKIKQQASQFFDKLNKNIVGPYALGQQFTVADILLYTHLERWNSIEHFTGYAIDANHEKIHNYIKEVQKRKSVSTYLQSKQAYIETIKKFF